MAPHDNMQWLRLGTPAEVETVLRPALAQISFNTCSGAGYREKKLGRLLTMVGHREGAHDRTVQVLGIVFAETPSLQSQALDLIAEVYASRHNGQSIHMWLPKTGESGK